MSARCSDMAGYDPYDGLRATRVPDWVKGTPLGRRVVIQLRKRVPFELGGILGIEPTLMAKAVACFATAAARRGDTEETDRLLGCLRSCDGSLGEGRYGYEFDVQTRWAFYPAGSPNIIATSFAARAWASALARGVRPDEARTELRDVAAYLTGSLLAEGERPYLRYVPTSATLVHNANILGCASLAWAACALEDDSLLDLAMRAAGTTVDAQAQNGSWAYGDAANLAWCDTFHTAYVIDGLLQLWLATGDERVYRSLTSGVAYWVAHFFEADGAPRYYADDRSPADIHGAATAVDTAYRLASHGFETRDVASACEEWTRRHLIDPLTGHTYYRVGRLGTDRRHFVRWGDAHQALAVASSGLQTHGEADPLESRLVSYRMRGEA